MAIEASYILGEVGGIPQEKTGGNDASFLLLLGIGPHNNNQLHRKLPGCWPPRNPWIPAGIEVSLSILRPSPWILQFTPYILLTFSSIFLILYVKEKVLVAGR